MSGNHVVLTKEERERLEEELNDLKTVKRPAVALEIQEARSHGDLSENAEYTEAKNEEARINGRIMDIEQILRVAELADETKLQGDVVGVGSVVRVYDMEYQEEDEYTIVGFTGADPMQMKISNESPIGAALMGAKEGDVVTADTPAGPVKMKVLSVGRASV